MFHDVTKRRGRDSVWFDTTTQEMEDLFKKFEENGETPVSLDQLYKHLTMGAQLPEKPVVLTFDDNYQGFYDNALPLLKKYKFPAAMFVHTNFVGSKVGRAKMTWDELKELASGDLVTIGSHTQSHPNDITLLTPSDQRTELEQSKKILEDKLGKPVDYFAYPDGKNDSVTQGLVREVGYKMAFTTDHGLAEESPNIAAIHRYVQTKADQAFEDRDNAKDNAPAAVVRMPLKDAPITYEQGRYAGIDMMFIRGGIPSSLRAGVRQGILDFVREANAQAGINGTFFALAAIKETSNEMVGPCFASNEKQWVPDNVPERLEKIRNRPLVVWGPKSIALVPFQGEQMNTEDAARYLMPEFTDAFVAGAWLVHEGKARNEDQLLAFSARDLMDPRRRAFFGVAADGTIVLGASLGSVGSDRLADAAAAAGVQEAVMMDSGFSTSLVYGDKVIASGHSTPTEPSRPVPHAIVLTGKLAIDPATISIPQPPAEPRRKRRKKKKVEEAPVDAPAPDVTITPDGAAPSDSPVPKDAGGDPGAKGDPGSKGDPSSQP